MQAMLSSHIEVKTVADRSTMSALWILTINIYSLKETGQSQMVVKYYYFAGILIHLDCYNLKM